MAIGLIDRFLITQDFLTEALRILRPEIKISNFKTAQDCIVDVCDDRELILYYL